MPSDPAINDPFGFFPPEYKTNPSIRLRAFLFVCPPPPSAHFRPQPGPLALALCRDPKLDKMSFEEPEDKGYNDLQMRDTEHQRDDVLVSHFSLFVLLATPNWYI